MTWWVVFCRLDLYRSATLAPGGHWEINVKYSWRNPPQNLSEARAICPKNRSRLWDKCKELFGEHSKEPFGRQKPFAAKNPRRQTCHFAPRTLVWLNTPKLRLLGKMPQRVEELGDKSKEVILLQNLLASQNGSAPEDQRDRETCATSVKPWWNLPRNLLAAQDGSAPENHRESESNSAPKPLLWLKTPKLLLLGKRDGTGRKLFGNKRPSNTCVVAWIFCGGWTFPISSILSSIALNPKDVLLPRP